MHRTARSRICASLVGVAVAAFVVSVAPLRAQDAQDGPQTPLREFKSQIVDAKKALEGVNGRIADSAAEIEKLSKPDAARKEIDDLLGLVSKNLAMVADDGEIAKLGDKALAYCRSKQASVKNDERFSEAERANLLARWDRNVADMDKAVRDLNSARVKFVDLLKVIQTRSDYAAELLEAENGAEMVKVIQGLAGEIRGSSDVLKGLIRGLSSPGV